MCRVIYAARFFPLVSSADFYQKHFLTYSTAAMALFEFFGLAKRFLGTRFFALATISLEFHESEAAIIVKPYINKTQWW
jgi:hypothetical protein